MFCSGCGNQLEDGARFCELCGAPVGEKLTLLFSQETCKEEHVGPDFLWLNFASLFFCLLSPTAIIALIYSIGARSSKGGCDWSSAGSRAAVARTMFWINLALAVVIYGMSLLYSAGK